MRGNLIEERGERMKGHVCACMLQVLHVDTVQRTSAEESVAGESRLAAGVMRN